MGKYALVIRAWGTSGSKYYNDYRTGETLLFNHKVDAENFKNKLKKESSKNVIFEVIEFKTKNKKEQLFDDNFIEKIGSKMVRG